MIANTPRPRRLSLAIGTTVMMGLPGIAVLPLVLPRVAGLHPALLLINPTLLLLARAALGALTAPQVGFRSGIVEWVMCLGRQEGRWLKGTTEAVLLGLALGLGITLLDHGTRSLWQAGLGSPPSTFEDWRPAALIVGVLYEGITEEIIMRWGLMSVIVWLASRVFAGLSWWASQRALWLGLGVAACLFAVAHLPVLLATNVEITPALATRTVGLNFVLGLIFGWLFASRSLESAILAHIGLHLGIGATHVTGML